MNKLQFLTAGESHGKALTGIIDGLPSGIPIDFEFIKNFMQERKKGYGRASRQKIETDDLEFLSGIRNSQTTGAPISFILPNKDHANWDGVLEIKKVEPAKAAAKALKHPRPGHADYVGGLKYEHQDMRNVLERASARETAARVAIASLCTIFLKELGIEFSSRVTRIGKIKDESKFSSSPHQDSLLRVISQEKEELMIGSIKKAKIEGNTLGGEFQIKCSGLPLGLGSFQQWNRRLEAKIAQQLMSLNAIKGVSIGDSFHHESLKGSEYIDEFCLQDDQVSYSSNHSGGVVGGMSTGQDLIVNACMKPISTLMRPLQSIDLKTKELVSAHVERSDVCAVPAAAFIGQALCALCFSEEILIEFGGSSFREIKERLQAWKKKTTY